MVRSLGECDLKWDCKGRLKAHYEDYVIHTKEFEWFLFAIEHKEEIGFEDVKLIWFEVCSYHEIWKMKSSCKSPFWS